MKVNYRSIIEQFPLPGDLPWYFKLRHNKVKITTVIYCGKAPGKKDIKIKGSHQEVVGLDLATAQPSL